MIEIQVDVATAESRVDSLSNKITGLAKVTDDSVRKMQASLNSALKSPLDKLNFPSKEIGDFNQMLKSTSDLLKEISSKSVSVAAVTKKATDAYAASTKVIKEQIAQEVESLRSKAKLVRAESEVAQASAASLKARATSFEAQLRMNQVLSKLENERIQTMAREIRQVASLEAANAKLVNSEAAIARSYNARAKALQDALKIENTARLRTIELKAKEIDVTSKLAEADNRAARAAAARVRAEANNLSANAQLGKSTTDFQLTGTRSQTAINRANKDLLVSQNNLTLAKARATAVEESLARAAENTRKTRVDELATLKGGVNIYEEYKTKVAALRAELAKYNATQGAAGISGATYQNSLSRLNTSLAEGHRALNTSAASLDRHRKASYAASQATAAFRSALDGANLHMSYITPKTVVATVAAYGFTKAIQTTIKTGMDFEATFERAAAVMGEFGDNSTDAINKGLKFGQLSSNAKLIKQQVLELAQATAFSTLEVAKGAETLARAGYDTLQVFNALEPVLNMATVGEMSVAEAASVATGVMTAFKLETNQLEYAVDAMALAANKSNLSLQDIASTMKYTSGTAGSLKVSLTDTLAMIEVLGQTNLKQSRAGTSLRTLIPEVINPSAGFKGLLKKYQLDIKDFVKNGTLDIRELFKAFNPKGGEQELAADLIKAFGKLRQEAALALRAAAIAPDDALGSWKKFRDELEAARGTSARLAAAMRDNVKQALENLSGAISTVGVKAFDVFGQDLQNSIQSLTDYIVKNQDVIAKSVADVVNTLVKLGGWIVKNAESLYTLFKAWATYTVAKTAISAMVAGLGLLERAIQRVTLAQQLNQTVGAAGMVGAMFGAKPKIPTTAAPAAVAAPNWTTSMGAAVGPAVVMAQASQQAPKVVSGMSAITKASVAASAAMTGLWASAKTLGSGLVGLATGGVSRLLGLLTGPWGLALTVAASFLPLFASALDNTKDEIVEYSNAMEIFTLANKLGENGLRGLSQTNLESMVAKFNEDVRKATDELKKAEALKEEAFAPSATGFANDVIDRMFGADGGMRSDTLLEAREDALRRQKEALEAVSDATATLKEKSDALTPTLDASLYVMGESAVTAGMFDENMRLSVEGYAQLKIALDSALGPMKEFELTALGISNLVNLGPAMLKRIGPMLNFYKGANDRTQALKDEQAQREEEAKIRAANSAAESAAAAANSKIQSSLEGYITSHEKATGSVAELTRKLRNLAEVQAAVASGNGAAQETLKEMGLTSAQAAEALGAEQKRMVFENLGQVLTTINPLFKDFNTTLGQTKVAGQEIEDPLQKATAFLQQLVDAGSIKPTQMTDWLKELAPAIRSVEDGTAGLAKEFATLKENVNTDWAGFLAPADLESAVQKYAQVKGISEDVIRQTLARKRIMQEYSEALKVPMSDQARMVELDKLLAASSMDAAQALLVKKNALDSTATGALQKANQHLENQILMIGQGTEALEIYNAAWEATGGHLENLDPAFIEAKKRNLELLESFRQYEEVQNVFKGFGDGVARAFSDSAMVGFRGFKDRLKDLFKQMISELIYMLLKNNIMQAFFGGQGNTQGMFAGIAQGFSQLFGGGGAQQGGSALSTVLGMFTGGGGRATGGGGGNAVSSALGLLGIGGSGSALASGGSSSGGGIGSLVSTAIQGYLGVPLGGGAASSGPGLTGWLSRLTNFGGFAPSMMGAGINGAAPVLTAAGRFGKGGASLLKDGPSALSGGGGAASLINSGGIMGGIGGLIMGSQAGSGGLSTVGSTLAYGLGGATLGAAGASVLATGSFAGAGTAISGLATSAGFSAGAAAAIPVIGWIVAAIAALDALTGGKVFGTKYKTNSVDETISIGDAGGTASLLANQSRQRALFGGTARRVKPLEAPDEMSEMASDFFRNIDRTRSMTGKELEVAMSRVIDASFTTTTKYDKKGKETGKTTSAVIDGEKFDNVEFEEFQKIVHAKQMIAVVAQSVQDILNRAADTAKLPPEISNEVSTIASRWKQDADLLTEGASLLVAAQNDMVDGIGIFQGLDLGLTKTVDLIEKNQNANESLADAYVRVRDTVKAVEENAGFLNLAMGRSREEFVDFSLELVNSLGGVEKAVEKLSIFSEAFGEVGAGSFGAQKALDKRRSLLEAIGVDPNATAEEFKRLFTLALPELDAEDLSSWIEAGNSIAYVSRALKELQSFAEGNPTDDIVTQVENQINAIARLGASEAELAQARDYGNMAIKRSLDEMMNGIEEALAGFEGRSNVFAVNGIQRDMEQTMTQARRLGASLQQLSRIQQLAGFRIQKVINDLRLSIADLAKQLFDTKKVEENTDAQLSGSSAVNNAELDRYQNAQDAIERIADFLKSLEISDLAPGTTFDQVNAASRQFSEMLAAAQSGDPEALSGITEAAQSYLQLARTYFGSTVDYANIYDDVTAALRALQGGLQGTQGGGGGNYSDSSSSSASASASNEISEGERFQLALQLAQEVGELAIILKTDVYGLLKESGIKLGELAEAMGIDLEKLTQQGVTNTGTLASALGVSISSLLKELGINSADLAEVFKINTAKLGEDAVTGLKALGEALGVNTFEAMDLLGIKLVDLATSIGISTTDLSVGSTAQLLEFSDSLGMTLTEVLERLNIGVADLAVSFGIDINNLNASMFDSLVQFAQMLGTDIVTMATTLGADFATVGQTISEAIYAELATLPDVPQSTKDQLAPYLTAIATATDATGVQTAIENLAGFTALLPAAQRDALTSLFKDLALDVSKPTKDMNQLIREYQLADAARQAALVGNTDAYLKPAENPVSDLIERDTNPILREMREAFLGEALLEKSFAQNKAQEFYQAQDENAREATAQQSVTTTAMVTEIKQMKVTLAGLTAETNERLTRSNALLQQNAGEVKNLDKTVKKGQNTPVTSKKV